MQSPSDALELAARVARAANACGIETAVIGALALAAHRWVRATQDVDLGAVVTNIDDLRRLEQMLAAEHLHTELRLPDVDDELGGVLEVWQYEDEAGEPMWPVEVVNFYNPHRPGRRGPAWDAIRNAVAAEGNDLRYVTLADLVALKLAAGGPRDKQDVLDVLRRNPEADPMELEAACAPHGLDIMLHELLAEARRQ